MGQAVLSDPGCDHLLDSREDMDEQPGRETPDADSRGGETIGKATERGEDQLLYEHRARTAHSRFPHHGTDRGDSRRGNRPREGSPSLYE